MKPLEKMARSVLTLVLTISLAAPAFGFGLTVDAEVAMTAPEPDCVPRIIRLLPETAAEKLDYIVTVFQIMATGKGDAGWGEGKLPYIWTGDESGMVSYADFSSIYAFDCIYEVIGYQMGYCDFEEMVDDVERFVVRYKQWYWFFCRSSETLTAYEEHVAYAQEEWCSDYTCSYSEFKSALNYTLYNLMKDYFEDDFYYDIYSDERTTGLMYIREMSCDSYYGRHDIKGAAEDGYTATRRYQKWLEAVLNGEVISFFGIDVNHDIW